MKPICDNSVTAKKIGHQLRRKPVPVSKEKKYKGARRLKGSKDRRARVYMSKQTTVEKERRRQKTAARLTSN